MIYILDETQAEDLGVLWEKKDCIRKFATVRCAAETLMEEFYECTSEYGDPVGQLLSYIPDNKLKTLLNDFHYAVGTSEDELWEAWENQKEGR